MHVAGPEVVEVLGDAEREPKEVGIPTPMGGLKVCWFGDRLMTPK